MPEDGPNCTATESGTALSRTGWVAVVARFNYVATLHDGT